MDYLQCQLDDLERIVSGEKKPDSLDLQLLRQITGNFSDDRRIGEGGCGEVYKGILPNRVVIAVKKLKNTHTIDEKMFLREVDSMIKVGHQNIVRFLGYCSETKEKAFQMDGRTVMAEERERLLCFEYIRRGSIDKYLTDELRGFEWCTRYQIIKGICNGLLHLHKEKRILHMDLKPANILLSDQMVPKITDFGLSRIDGISQTMSAQRLLSPGYCAPEYVENGKRSLKSDIYSLGVIMIELVTGSRQQVPNITKVLRKWRHRWSKSSKHIPIWYQQVKTCLELGVSCKEKNPINRPFIWDVVRELTKLDGWDGEIRESSINKIISSSDDMLGIEPLELDFTPSHHKKQISCSIELTNDTDYYMVFRIATTSLLPFSIKPAKGIAAPRSKCTASITLSEQEMTPLHNRCEEEFVVQSTRIDGSLTDVDVTDDMFNDEWGNSQKKVDDGDKVVDEVNLTVPFDKMLHKEHQKDVANLSAEMGSLVTSSQEVQKSVELSPHQDYEDLRPFRRTITSWLKGALLGSGFYGSVYEGISDDGFFFAVKEVSLMDQRLNTKEHILQLEHEISILSHLEHENIVQYFGTDKDGVRLYIFLELVTKGSMAHLYQKYRLRDSQVSTYTRQILNGLHYLHQQNVLHGDIKCANILIDASGLVKLADFGLANKMSILSQAKSSTGTVYWKSPEVAHGKPHRPPADIWSLGCTVLEMLTGKVPYPDMEWTHALLKIGSGIPPEIPNTLSEVARDFIKKCVQANPNDRPSAAQLFEHPFVKRPRQQYGA